MFAIIGSTAFGAAAILYILLALGLPLGEFAMGGQYKVLPPKLRAACVVSVLIQVFAIIILLQTGGLVPLFLSAGVTRGICIFFAVYISVNVLFNFLSNSKKERFLAGPLSVVTSVCFWVTALTA